MVDVGTGSGAVAVAVVAGAPAGVALRVVAVDRSAAGLAVARENARRLLGAARAGAGAAPVDFLQGHLLTALRGPFDLVLANLPYVPAGDVPGRRRRWPASSRTWPWTAGRTGSTSTATC